MLYRGLANHVTTWFIQRRWLLILYFFNYFVLFLVYDYYHPLIIFVSFVVCLFFFGSHCPILFWIPHTFAMPNLTVTVPHTIHIVTTICFRIKSPEEGQFYRLKYRGKFYFLVVFFLLFIIETAGFGLQSFLYKFQWFSFTRETVSRVVHTVRH